MYRMWCCYYSGGQNKNAKHLWYLMEMHMFTFLQVIYMLYACVRMKVFMLTMLYGFILKNNHHCMALERLLKMRNCEKCLCMSMNVFSFSRTEREHLWVNLRVAVAAMFFVFSSVGLFFSFWFNCSFTSFHFVRVWLQKGQYRIVSKSQP